MRRPVDYGTARPAAILRAIGQRLSDQGRAHVKLAQAKAVAAVYSGSAVTYDPGEAIYSAAYAVLDLLEPRLPAPITQKRPLSP